MRRARFLEDNPPALGLTHGSKSIGVEFDLPDTETKAHMTFAYFPGGLPEGADEAVAEFLHLEE